MTGETPILQSLGLSKWFGKREAIIDISFSLWPGEMLAIVGESGSGKSTLLNCLSGRDRADTGTVLFNTRHDGMQDLYRIGEARRRLLERTEWGFVHQNANEGLRMAVSAGANVGERLMATGNRHYGSIRSKAVHWLERVELNMDRIDDMPETLSGGMRQRLQIARNLVNQPRLVFMDEPTSGLDVSVQARLLDLLRTLTRQMHLAAIVVTHDLAVARFLCERIMVMKDGRVVECGLTDQVLDDPQHPYSQLLVSSVLPA